MKKFAIIVLATIVLAFATGCALLGVGAQDAVSTGRQVDAAAAAEVDRLAELFDRRAAALDLLIVNRASPTPNDLLLITRQGELRESAEAARNLAARMRAGASPVPESPTPGGS